MTDETKHLLLISNSTQFGRGYLDHAEAEIRDLLGPSARVVGPFTASTPRDAEASRDRSLEEALRFPEPVPAYAEKVFYHTLGAAADGRTEVALLNDRCAGRPLGVVMHLRLSQLGCFTEWKMPRQGFYVLGLEPGTVYPEGRGSARQAGRLPMLQGMASHEVDIELEVVEGAPALAEAEKRIASIPV